MTLIGRHFFHNVKSDRIIKIGRIKIDYVVDSIRRNEFQNAFGRLAVRVNKANASSSQNVLYRHIFQQGGFSHAGFPDDVNVPTTIIDLNPKLLPLIAEGRFGKKINLAFHNNCLKIATQTAIPREAVFSFPLLKRRPPETPAKTGNEIKKPA